MSKCTAAGARFKDGERFCDKILNWLQNARRRGFGGNSFFICHEAHLNRAASSDLIAAIQLLPRCSLFRQSVSYGCDEHNKWY